MTKLYYKRQFGTLECVKAEGEGRLVTFIFDEPIEGKICVSKKHAYVKLGIGTIDLSELECGIYAPKLLRKGASEKIGKILLCEGGVSQNPQNSELALAFTEKLLEIECELKYLKRENEMLREKIYGTSIFKF